MKWNKMKPIRLTTIILLLHLYFSTQAQDPYCSGIDFYIVNSELTGTYEAGQIICQNVSVTDEAHLIADDHILLSPDFEVLLGATFTAEISDCRDNKPYINIPAPQTIMDNGCNGIDDQMEWYFEWNEVAGAAQYQLLIEHPSVGQVTFNEIVTTNHWTFNEATQINTYFDNWTAKVRAYVDGEWTLWYGSFSDQVLYFDVEQVNKDCAPVLTNPQPQAVLENGCSEGYSRYIWNFDWTPISIVTQYEILVKKPDGSTYLSELFDTGTTGWLMLFQNDFIPSDELINWSAQIRGKIEGSWTAWHGQSLTEPQTYFNVAPSKTDCVPLITSPTTQAVLDNGCDGTLETMDWHFEWTAVEFATEYQLILEHPNIGFPSFNQTLTTTSWTYSEIDRISSNYNGWTAKVRAKVFNYWTPWHGSKLEETVMLFNVEPKNTDCAPLVTLPLPQAILDNGCSEDNGEVYQIHWEFKNAYLSAATDYEIRVNDPEGDVFMHFSSQGYRETWSYYFNPEILSSTEINNWSVQFRAKINGSWTIWYGHSLSTPATFFDLEPLDSDCPNVSPPEVEKSIIRSSNEETSLESVSFTIYPNPFQRSSTIAYRLEQVATVHLGIYNLTGQEINILVNQKQQSKGAYRIPFSLDQEMQTGMYWVRLQVGEEVFFRKLAFLD